MIDPKEPIGEIFALYPTVRNLYEEKHIVDDDTITTEAFCDKYDVSFFDLWMAVGREVKTIDAARIKENEVKTKDEAKKEKQKRQKLNFKTMDEDRKRYIVSGLYVLLIGVLVVCLSFLIHNLTLFFIGAVFVVVSAVVIIQGLTGKGIRKYHSFKEMTRDEQETMIFSLICLLIGASLYFVSHILDWSAIFKIIGVGVASLGGTRILFLMRKKD